MTISFQIAQLINGTFKTSVPFLKLDRLIKGERYDFHWESRLAKYSLKPLESQNQFAHFLWVGNVCFHMTLSRKLANVSNSSPEALEKSPLSLWISTTPLSYTKTCRDEHKQLRQSRVKRNEIVFFFCTVLIFLNLFLGWTEAMEECIAIYRYKITQEIKKTSYSHQLVVLPSIFRSTRSFQ